MSSSEEYVSDFSSEDEAPEDISFKSSKENAISSLKSIKETLDREKSIQKQHRKAVENRNIEQKKRKLLPVQFLDQVDRALEERQAVKRALDNETKQLKMKKKNTPEENRINIYTNNDRDNIVPLVKTKQFTKKPDITAAEFKQKMLYRSGNKRISSEDSLRLKKKRLQKIGKR